MHKNAGSGLLAGTHLKRMTMITMITMNNAMDIPQSLCSILNGVDVNLGRHFDKNDNDDSLERLQSLNQEMEASFGKQLTQVDDCELLFHSLKDCINLLQYKLLNCLFYGLKNDEDNHTNGNDFQSKEDLQSLLESTNDNDDEYGDDNVIQQLSVYISNALTIEARKKMEHTKTESSIIDSKFWIVLSEILRTCKNSIRWKRQVWTYIAKYERSSAVAMKNPISRLQNVRMIELYLNLMIVNGGDDDRSDVARNASLVLFHATFGQTEVDSSQARNKLVQYGLPILMKLIDHDDEQQSVPFMLSIVRHVHNLISTMEEAIPKMNQHLVKSKKEGEGGSKNLFTVLVSKLSQTIKSDQPTKFPGSDDDINDRRSDLFIEIIRVLFVISNRGKESVQELEQNNKESMKELGFVLCDTLLLSDETSKIKNLDINKAHQCQLAAVQLLMDSPPEYGQFLVQKKAIRPLLFIFSNQLTKIIENGRNHGLAHGTQQDAALILPILVVLNRLSTSIPTVVSSIRDFVFPPECEDAFIAKVKEEKALVSSGERGLGAKNMKPIDAPKDTVRWRLIKLMTWPETSVKRCTGELLWTICNCNATEFVLRLGFGNAVHFLSIKGLVKIPEQSSVVTNNN